MLRPPWCLFLIVAVAITCHAGACERRAAAVRDQAGAFLGVQVASAEGGGAKVLHVYEGTAAEESGIQVDDRVLAVEGEPVSGSEDLVRRIQSRRPDEMVVLTLVRGGERFLRIARLGRRGEPPRLAAAPDPDDTTILATRRWMELDRLRQELASGVSVEPGEVSESEWDSHEPHRGFDATAGEIEEEIEEAFEEIEDDFEKWIERFEEEVEKRLKDSKVSREAVEHSVTEAVEAMLDALEERLGALTREIERDVGGRLRESRVSQEAAREVVARALEGLTAALDEWNHDVEDRLDAFGEKMERRLEKRRKR